MSKVDDIFRRAAERNRVESLKVERPPRDMSAHMDALAAQEDAERKARLARFETDGTTDAVRDVQ